VPDTASTAGAVGTTGGDGAARYPGEAADPYCLRDGEAARLLANHRWHRFVVVGDSIAAGLGDPSPGYPDQPWCDRIAAELRRQQPDLAYLNLGTKNTRAATVAARQLPAALAFAPDLALVACGGYGILLSRYDADADEAALRMIVAALAAPGCDVVTVGLFDGSYSPAVPEPFRPLMRERLHELSRRTKALSADLGALYVELTYHPATRDADLYSADSRHGTMRGHAISAAQTIRLLGAHLGNAGQANGGAGSGADGSADGGRADGGADGGRADGGRADGGADGGRADGGADGGHG
jgi:lysophospholipase L1-like esterase